ncbi:PREDICTED: uncharacterized protein LOC104767751 [Camelina sativa]|uniref:Uncharacterized protein LOC104767751 n=1 Tax=Camelina sativa TaxID=90675 RepID=A0ABM0XRU7_CAMSA|nr:PREDICTED: uncharacterized protein LOC104767751 [Camelina sativa]
MKNKLVDRPPCTYSMKIQSLSQLKELFPESEYKSLTFSSGKYNWRLVIYPTGNEKDNGKGFISMYVELDTSSLTASTVLAYFTFFVYNKKENKYFTIQEVEGKQFNAIRPVWGFPRVLPLDTFNDPKNGYVFEGDQCEFGVDVMVPLVNWEVVSFPMKPPNTKFSWTVKKFSKLKGHCYVLIGWVLYGRKDLLYPKGYSTTYSKFLSIFVQLADSETMKAGEQIHARGDIRILDPFGQDHMTGQIDIIRNYNDGNKGRGWNHFAYIDELRGAYLDKEVSLKVEAEFEVVSTTSSST